MPPEPTKARLKRRSSRKELDEFRFDGTHARELELKRNRGEVSCAECRRLKIKCDKQIPCQSCQRRGCTALCPNGSLSTGQGTRFVLAATEHLHKRISKLSNRVRQLEDALANLQAKHSTEPHPLLHADLISKDDLRYQGGFDEGEEGMDVEDEFDGGEDAPGAASGSGQRASKSKEKSEKKKGKERAGGEKGNGEIIDAFGTLSISQHGVSRFFGPTGGSESLLLSNVDTPYYDLPAASAAAAAQASLASHAASASLTLTQSNARSTSSSVSPALSAASPSGDVPLRDSISPCGSSSTGIDVGGVAGASGRIDASLSLFSSSFPFTPVSQPPEEVQGLLEREHLPRWDVALGLSKTYFDQVGWLFRGLSRDQLEKDMLPVIYTRRRRARFEYDLEEEPPEGFLAKGAERSGSEDSEEGETENDDEEWAGPHALALVFTVFALGALVGGPITTSPIPSHATAPPSSTGPSSTTQPKINHYTGPAQAEHFYHLARASLALLPLLEKPSIVTIQTLHLMSVYNAMSGSDMRSETSMELTWGCVTLGAHLAQTIGLHRDCERWGLSKRMVLRRRVVFWDLFVADVWQSLNTGRPPTFSLPYIDCRYPQYDDVEGKLPFDLEYEVWSFRFAAEVVAEVTARTLTAEAPTYATIMELDRKVREFPLPASLASKDGASDNDYVGDFQRCVLDHIKETILLYLHRSFFAQAIIDHPENPLKSAYAPSFLASYRASSTILKTVSEQFKVWPGSSARFWVMWTFAFTAAVVFGTVVTRGPRSPLAKSAMRELEQACVLFSKASMYSVRATKALPILKKLNEKAHYALQAAQSNATESSDPALADAGIHWSVKKEDTEDELAIFAGHTRFVSAMGKDPKDKSSEVSTPTILATMGGGTTAGGSKEGGSSGIHLPAPPPLAFEAGTGMFQTTPISHPQPHAPYLSQRALQPATAPPQHSMVHAPALGSSYVQNTRPGPPSAGLGVGVGLGYGGQSGGSGGSGTPEDDTSMDTSGSDARWAGVRHYGPPAPPPPQHHHQSMDHQVHAPGHPYAAYTPPEQPRRMHSYDWSATAAQTTSPTTVRLEEHQPSQQQPHHAPPQPRMIPRISRLPSHQSLYAGSSSYPNSSSESIELVSVPQAPSGSAGGGEYMGGSYHQHQHHQPPPHHHHHPPPGPQTQHHHQPPPQHHPQAYQHHQHHAHSMSPTTPQYQPMYSAFGASSGHQHHVQQHPGHPSGSHTSNRMTGIQSTAANDLADLGIASRDSRLDEKWSMFMSESGILEPGFRG